MTESSEKHRLGRVFSYGAMAVTGFCLMYVLSIGPAVVIGFKIPASRELLGAIYFPVLWLRDHTFLQSALDSYLTFWERVARGF